MSATSFASLLVTVGTDNSHGDFYRLAVYVALARAMCVGEPNCSIDLHLAVSVHPDNQICKPARNQR